MTGKTLAIAQAPSTPGDLGANVEQAVALIAGAARAGADIVVFPELFLCGYDIEGIAADPQRHVVRLEDPHGRALARACAEQDIAAVIGGAIEVDDGIANAALVLGRHGEAVHVYRKVHLWGPEANVFVPGDKPVLIELDGVRLGLSICFDAGFPEHMRALALAGAEAIACPGAFAHHERRRYELYFPTRALENTLYLAAANAVGPQGGLEMFGDSLLCGPRGEEISRIRSAVGIETVPIDRAAITRAREDLPYLRGVPEPVAPTLINWS